MPHLHQPNQLNPQSFARAQPWKVFMMSLHQDHHLLESIHWVHQKIYINLPIICPLSWPNQSLPQTTIILTPVPSIPLQSQPARVTNSSPVPAGKESTTIFSRKSRKSQLMERLLSSWKTTERVSPKSLFLKINSIPSLKRSEVNLPAKILPMTTLLTNSRINTWQKMLSSKLNNQLWEANLILLHIPTENWLSSLNTWKRNSIRRLRPEWNSNKNTVPFKVIDTLEDS